MGPLSLTSTAQSDTGTDAPSVELVALTWERIQLIIRLRAGDQTTLDPRSLCLQSAVDPSIAVPPARGWVADGDLFARFNVMRGPDQMPLEAGRWVLRECAGEGIVPLRVGVDGRLEPSKHAGRFIVSLGEYSAVPGLDRATGTLFVDVALDPSLAPPREPLPLAHRLRRIFWRRPRRWAIESASRALYRGFRRFTRHTGDRILFISDYHAHLRGNLQAVHDRMVERGLDRRYELLTLTKRRFRSRRNVREWLRLTRLLARADLIVTDNQQKVIYRAADPAIKVIQLWHAAGAFKTVGYSRVGKEISTNPYWTVHKRYDYVTVSSENDVPFYAEAFGIPEERVVPTGVPRMDRFFDERYAATARAAALDAFPEARGRMVILFAPTFRGTTRESTYDLGPLDYAVLHELCLAKDAVFIIRMHPFAAQPLGIPTKYADRLLDGLRSTIDVNDLLFAVDLLVTDYSSIVFEYATLGRPMLFFAPDLEDYIAARDFYVTYEEFVPGRIVRTFEEMVDAIRRDDYQAEKVGPFRERHFSHLDGHSTDRVIDLIVSTLSGSRT